MYSPLRQIQHEKFHRKSLLQIVRGRKAKQSNNSYLINPSIRESIIP